MVERDQRILATIAERWRTGSVLVIGSPESGKLTALRAIAGQLTDGDRPALEFAATPFTTLEDMAGRFARVTSAKKTTSGPRFVPGLLVEAMREGRKIIVVDADELTGAARGALLAVLHGDPLPPLRGGGHVTTLVHPGFALAATATREDFELAGAFSAVIRLD